MWMGGLVESQEGNYSKALELWRRLEVELSDPGALQNLRKLITEIEKKQSEKGQTP
jgi:hypothetical protein